MTAAQMKSEFLIRYDALSYGAPGWEDTDIEQFLNIAQMEIVKELFAAKRYDLLTEIWDEFDTIIDSVEYAINIKKAQLPSDLLFYISSKTKLYISNPIVGDAKLYTAVNEEINMFKADQFLPKSLTDYTLFRQPKCYIEAGFLKVIVDSYSDEVLNIYVTYLRIPVNIKITSTAVNCELNESLHKSIVENAVGQALRAIVGSKLKTE